MTAQHMHTEITPIAARHALVLGASGLVGRHLMLALTNAGAEVTAAVRSVESGDSVQQWLRSHGATQDIRTVIVDFDAPGIIDGGQSICATVTEIHNCAGLYRFGMTAEEARSANVGIVEKLIRFATTLPMLQRFVHISGYRVGGQDPATVPWSDTHRDALYKKLGAYEASKVESDAIIQALAQTSEIPLTIVNPSSVIGDSATGESEQFIGLASTVEQIYNREMSALPSGDAVFLPIVTVDYFAKFMAAAAVDPAAAGRAYWVLDDNTPPLAALLEHLGEHLGVRVPKLKIPVRVIQHLPRWITRADPETLTFMSTDRYPTAAANELAARHGLEQPDTLISLERWADYLAAHRFGAAGEHDRRFINAAGIRTFELGKHNSDRVIFPGLPVNADTWAGVAAGIRGRSLDLPGLGLSSGNGIRDWQQWLSAVLGDQPTHLIGHSIGAAAAVLAAKEHPERVKSLTLVAPFFLQTPARGIAASRSLVSAYLRRATPTHLSRQLTASASSADALASSVSDLKRGTAKRVAAHLTAARSAAWRADLRDALSGFSGPIQIIWGSDDPLENTAVEGLQSQANIEFSMIQGAGHHPQLTHAEELLELLERLALLRR